MQAPERREERPPTDCSMGGFWFWNVSAGRGPVRPASLQSEGVDRDFQISGSFSGVPL